MSKSPRSRITAVTKLGSAGLRLSFELLSKGPRGYRHSFGQKTLFHLLPEDVWPSKDPLPGYVFAKGDTSYDVVFWQAQLAKEDVTEESVAKAWAALGDLKAGAEFEHSHGQGKLVYLKTSYDACYHFVAIDQGIAAITALVQDSRFAHSAPPVIHWFQSAAHLAQLPAIDELKAVYGPLAIKQGSADDLEAMAADLCAEAKQAKGPFYLAGDGKLLTELKKRIVMMGIYEDHIPVETTHNPVPRFKVDKTALKEGLTTGACSTAAAKAATLIATGLGADIGEVKSVLPMGREVVFSLFRSSAIPGGAKVSVIKNAGDDPDVTHGAEITATVTVAKDPGIELHNGKGVARVTKPGLGLTVGGPAINPVPRQTITAQVQEVLDQSSEFSGAKVTISIEDGEDRAKNTTNARLGLLGGLSILGTTGIVKPYSTAAFVASVTQSIKLAGTDGYKALVFTTGGRSEQFAMKLLPSIAESCFIQVGDYIGVALRNSVAASMDTVYIVAMVGKLSKMADGRMMTHASGSEVNMQLLADLAGRSGASEQAKVDILQANTARHVLDICTAEGMAPALCETICLEVKKITEKFSKQKLTINVVMVDFVGRVIAKYPPDVTLAEKPSQQRTSTTVSKHMSTK